MKTVFQNSLRIFLLFLLLALGVGSQKAQAQFSAYEIRGMMLYNFARFVTWPEKISSQDKIVLGILGDDPFGDIIENTLKNRRIRGKTWEIKRANTLSGLKGSHIIFVTKSKEYEAREILAEINSFRYRGQGILTVGDDIDDFCANGGIMNIDMRNRFTINSDAANSARLIIDSRLWQMAKAIEAYGNK